MASALRRHQLLLPHLHSELPLPSPVALVASALRRQLLLPHSELPLPSPVALVASALRRHQLLPHLHSERLPRPQDSELLRLRQHLARPGWLLQVPLRREESAWLPGQVVRRT